MNMALKFLPILFLCVVLQSNGSTAEAEHEKAVRVSACPAASRAPPITMECVAAAIAEDAFLRVTEHKIDHYMISVFRPSSSQRWALVIEQGDAATNPGPTGSHWFVFVDRSSGATEVVSGR
jgi:hypothetical protein